MKVKHLSKDLQLGEICKTLRTPQGPPISLISFYVLYATIEVKNSIQAHPRLYLIKAYMQDSTHFD